MPKEEVKDDMTSLNCKRDMIIFSHKVMGIISLALAVRNKTQQPVQRGNRTRLLGDFQDIILFPVAHAIERQEISLPPTFFFFFESPFPCRLPQVLG